MGFKISDFINAYSGQLIANITNGTLKSKLSSIDQGAKGDKDNYADENELQAFALEIDDVEVLQGYMPTNQPPDGSGAPSGKKGIKPDPEKDNAPYIEVVAWNAGQIEEGNERRNDCLERIAKNYKPEGMSLQDAMDALMKENPQIYGDGAKKYNSDSTRGSRTGTVQERWIYDGEPVYLPKEWVEAMDKAHDAGNDNPNTGGNAPDAPDNGHDANADKHGGVKNKTTEYVSEYDPSAGTVETTTYNDGCVHKVYKDQGGNATGCNFTTAKDENGSYTSTNYRPDGETKTSEYVYQDANHIKSSKEFYSNGKLKNETVFEWIPPDNKARNVTIKEYDESGTVTKTTYREIDANHKTQYEEVDGVVTIGATPVIPANASDIEKALLTAGISADDVKLIKGGNPNAIQNVLSKLNSNTMEYKALELLMKMNDGSSAREIIYPALADNGSTKFRDNINFVEMFEKYNQFLGNDSAYIDVIAKLGGDANCKLSDTSVATLADAIDKIYSKQHPNATTSEKGAFIDSIKGKINSINANVYKQTNLYKSSSEYRDAQFSDFWGKNDNHKFNKFQTQIDKAKELGYGDVTIGTSPTDKANADSVVSQIVNIFAVNNGIWSDSNKETFIKLMKTLSPEDMAYVAKQVEEQIHGFSPARNIPIKDNGLFSNPDYVSSKDVTFAAIVRRYLSSNWQGAFKWNDQDSDVIKKLVMARIF